MNYNRDELYINENGRCAYLAGALNAVTDNFDCRLYQANVHYETVYCDLFSIGECNSDIIRELLKSRIKLLQNHDANRSDIVDAEIDELKIMESTKSMEQALYSLYEKRTDADPEGVQEAIKGYCADVRYYLEKPKKLYEVDQSTVVMDGEISNTYIGILFNILFVEFESHLLMILHGSSE